MASLEVLSRKVRQFYANVDPSKSQADMDEVTFAAYSKGEEVVNAQLRAKYGADLNTFASSAPPVVVAASPLYQNPAMTAPVTKVVYVQQVPNGAGGYTMAPYGGPTPFASSPNYQYGGYHDPYYQQRRNNNDDLCFCLTAMLACLICFD